MCQVEFASIVFKFQLKIERKKDKFAQFDQKNVTVEKKIVCDTGKNFFHKPRLLLPEAATIKRKENLNYKVDNIAFLYLYLQLGHPKNGSLNFQESTWNLAKKLESNFFGQLIDV